MTMTHTTPNDRYFHSYEVNKFEDIALLKSLNNYTLIITVRGEKILTCKHLGYYEELLASKINFIRTHKSYIINMECIEDLQFNCRGGQVRIHKTEVEISRRKVAQFRRAFRYFLKSIHTYQTFQLKTLL